MFKAGRFVKPELVGIKTKEASRAPKRECYDEAMDRRAVISTVVIGGIIAFFGAGFVLFAAPQSGAAVEQFVVAPGATSTVVQSVRDQGFVKNAFGLTLALHGRRVAPGGYLISKAMNAWQVANVLAAPPALRWVVIPEGLRKEEIVELLASALGWTEAQKQEWLTIDTVQPPDYFEGVYFPDTYLVPADETPAAVANRLRAKFNEAFAPYAPEAVKQNIKWNTLLKVASLIQREAAGKSDMPLIAGILWNRLLQGMKLEVDATLQYARGNVGQGWWAPITVADKQLDSPYNTYKYKGLPPHPIANPGLDAILAALRPASTTCLYYLHDATRTIHCASTYAEHQANIERYLK